MTADDPIELLAEAVSRLMPAVVDDLRGLVAIESVSADPGRAPLVQRSAEAVADLLETVGCPDVRVVRAGGAPAVIGRFPAPPGAPTICLYAHHDVQPTGARSAWHSEPFEATERDGRLFGRGTADDKGGVAVHLAALRAFDGRPPVGVTVFVEGEEEVGSPTLARLLAEHRDELAADAYVITDSTNWQVGQPAFTTTLRGIADCVVAVRTLDHAIHSGSFGGPVPDALTTLCRLLATLHDADGSVAVPGLQRSSGPAPDYPAERLRAESGLLPGVDLIGAGPLADRLWRAPAIAVIGLDATPVDDASNTLIPAARAKISIRVAPGDDADAALAAVEEHLRCHIGWGAQLEITSGETGQPCEVPLAGPYAEAARAAFARAWGTEPVTVGQGGSIPLVAEFQQAFPAAEILVTAVADPDTRAHGADESVHLGDLAKACLAEALLLRSFADLHR